MLSDGSLGGHLAQSIFIYIPEINTLLIGKKVGIYKKNVPEVQKHFKIRNRFEDNDISNIIVIVFRNFLLKCTFM